MVRVKGIAVHQLAALLALALSGCAPMPVPAGVSASPTAAEPGPTPQAPVTAEPLPTVPPPERRLYVVDPNDQGTLSSLFMIDADTGRIAWTLTTRFLPEAVLSPDGLRLYVADSYRTQVTRGEARDVLSVYDALSGALLVDDVDIRGRLQYKMLPDFSSPSLNLSEDGQLLYVGKYGDPDVHQLRLAVHDAHTLQRLNEVAYPPCGRLLAARADRWLCASQTITSPLPAAQVSLTVEWLDPLGAAAPEIIVTMTVPPVTDFALSADGATVYLLHANASVSRLSLAERALAPAQALEAPTGWQPDRFAIAPDASRLYVGFDTGSDDNSVFTDAIFAYDTATWKQVGSLQLPDAISFFTLNRNGDRLFVVAPGSRRLTAYDAATLQPAFGLDGLGGSPALILD